MLEKIKEALKKKGLPEDMAGLINVTEENQIEDAVGKLSEQVQTLLQKEGDKRATDATKTAQKNVIKKLGFDENKSVEEIKEALGAAQTAGESPSSQQTTTGQQTGNNPNASGQANQQNPEVEQLKTQMQKLQGTIEQMTEKEEISKRKNQFVEKLKKKNIPENFAKTFADNADFKNLDSEEKIDSYVTTVENAANEFEKEKISNNVEGQTPGQGKSNEEVAKLVAEQAKERHTPNSEGEGKEV